MSFSKPINSFECLQYPSLPPSQESPLDLSKRVSPYRRPQAKPSGWITVWGSFMEFDLNPEQDTSIHFSLVQQGADHKTASLKLWRVGQTDQIIFLRKSDLYELKTALYDYPHMDDKTVIVEQNNRKLELIKNEEGYQLRSFCFDRQVKLQILFADIEKLRNKLHSVSVILSVRAADKTEQLKQYQYDVLAHMFLYYIKKQMAKNVCRGCDDDIPTQLAHSCGNGTTFIHGRHVSVKFHEAAMVVLDEQKDYSVMYRRLLELLKIAEPSGLKHEDLLDAIYIRAYFMSSSVAVKLLVPAHIITVLIESQ
ncbi:hypothetical protein HDE_00460 [Halotydeus destructor]|nr:hypothetical protein HDE_00460 [Halotydeus destructor]